MHVLHLHSGNLYGGIERVLTTLARHGLGEGVTQSFALCFEGRLSAELRERGAAVELLGPVRASRPLSVLAARRRLRSLVAARTPGVIVTHLPWAQGVFGPVIHDAACPSVQWIHGAIEGWVGRWAARWLPDALICNSAYTVRSLPAAFSALPATVIRYPLEPHPSGTAESRDAIRASLRTAPADVVIVQASRFEAWKGHDVLIRALAELRHVQGWMLWIVGGAQRPEEGTYERRVRRLVQKSGLADKVRFTGEQADVWPYLAAADVYCQPNRAPEAFGLAYVEALAAGLPVVASSIGALPEVVDAETGMLVAPGDVQALASALRQLVEDTALRRRMGARGPARATALCDPASAIARLRAFLCETAAEAVRP